MAVKLSFILPCYNVERYIADCLDSIYAQGLLESEFEVICVNDCSTDGTRNIILEYSKIHDNLFLIDHTQNLTAGGARNTGIDNAKGDYIWFVDPDDMVKANMAEPLYEKASTNNLDILFFNNDIVDEHLSYLETENVFVDTETLSGQDYVIRYFRNQLSKLCIVWRCLFKTTFIKNNVLSFPQLRKAQDVIFNERRLEQATPHNTQLRQLVPEIPNHIVLTRQSFCINKDIFCLQIRKMFVNNVIIKKQNVQIVGTRFLV